MNMADNAFQTTKIMKKTLALLLLFCSVTTHLTAQHSWQSMMDDRTANFFEIQADFYLYYDSVMAGSTEIPKGHGIKQFKRWEYYWESRVDENGNFPQDGDVLTEVKRYMNDNAGRSYQTGTGDWQVVGPVALPANGTGQPNGNGRVNCIAFHPTEANTLYTGAPSGGFWKSTDNGGSWTEYSAGLARLGVSSIVIHPSDPDIIHIGTGDRDAGDAPGYGVWRSTDGGISWSAHNSGMGNRTVYEILMHPIDPLILIASTAGQIYRSTNGGASWALSYNGGESFKDIAFHPADPNIVYAAGSNYYRSTDNGITWTQVTAGVPTGTSRMALAVSADLPSYVYLIAGDGSGFNGAYRSTDNGLTFSTRATSPNIFGYDVSGGTGSQAWYDCVAIGDPTDGDHIVMGGVNLWESFDGGSIWSIVSHWVGYGGNPAIHADQHALEYSPLTGDLYNGNDGGVYYSSDAGASWTDLSSGLGIAQVYKIGVALSVSDLVINGYQDNGTAISDQGVFSTEIGGDGMECIIDPIDENYMYGALYYGDVRRSTNRGTSFSGITGGIAESGAWVTPYTLDPNSTSRMYIGMNNVWRSDDVKAGTPAWSQISSFAGSSTLRDMAIAPSNSNVMYVSRSGSSNFYRSDNATSGSPTWTDLDGSLPSSSMPNDIAIDATDPTHVFIALGNNIYESTNSGASWTDYSGTLPNISLNTIAIDENSPIEAIYLGNDEGVYYRDNTLADWEPYSTGFPNLEVTELEIYSNVNDCDPALFASTYGQGLWKSNLKDPGNVAPIACFRSDHVDGCTGDVFTFTDKSSYTPTSWTWAIAPATFSFTGGTNANSQNPQIQFSAAGVYDIALTATNGTGSNVQTKVAYIAVSNASPATGFNEDFESIALCGTAADCGTTVCDLTGSLWSNALNGTDDNIDFRVDDGGTPSTGTGPSVDYAPGTSTGNYIYTEASSCSGALAVLQSQCIDLDQAYEFSFAYHMQGADMGELHLDISTGGSWQNDVTAPIVGDQGAAWVLRTVDLSSYTGSSIKLRFRGITGLQYTSDIALDGFVFTPQSVLVDVAALLEGPFDGSALMDPGVDGLVDFPLTDPYPALGYVHTGSGNAGVLNPLLLGQGTSTRIIDWAVVELRDAVDPSVVVASRSGLIRAGGSIAELDNSSPLAFAVPEGDYYVAVRHRNHLGIMTAATVALSGTAQSVSLDLASTATHGVDATKVAGTKQLMWAGDVNFDGTVQYTGSGNDREPILQAIGSGTPTGSVSGYHSEDLNLDGNVKYTGTANDRDIILFNIGGTVPTNVRVEQLP